MKLEDQVVSLELAKKLKELGFKQESLFYWIEIRQIDPYIAYGSKFKPEVSYSAFTVAELGEMLPVEILVNKISYYPEFINLGNGWSMGYYGDNKKTLYILQSKTEADARAKMLIYLKENKLI